MMNFLLKSKVSAKNRLYACIQSDRETVRGNNIELLRRELESVMKRYVEIEGSITVEVIRKGRNKSYITAQAGIKV